MKALLLILFSSFLILTGCTGGNDSAKEAFTNFDWSTLKIQHKMTDMQKSYFSALPSKKKKDVTQFQTVPDQWEAFQKMWRAHVKKTY